MEGGCGWVMGRLGRKKSLGDSFWGGKEGDESVWRGGKGKEEKGLWDGKWREKWRGERWGMKEKVEGEKVKKKVEGKK